MTVIPLAYYLILSALIFGISIGGIVMNRHHLIKALMSIELMLLAVIINFVAFSQYAFNGVGDIAGQVFVFFILTVAAAESAIGLAIIVLVFRRRGSIDIVTLNELRG